MTRRTVIIAALATGLALLALLGYSLERTAWIFDQFETEPALAYAAAVVIELTAVALIAGASAIAGLDPAARAWANRALLAVLSTQALANLAAGYLRGGQATLGLFGGTWPAYSVPALVLCLSKLLERLIASPAMRRTRRDLRAQRRALVRRLIDRLRTARAVLDAATADLAQARAQAAQVQGQLAQLQATAAQPDPLLAQLQAETAQQEQTIAHLTAQLAQLREQAAQPIVFDGIDVLKVARRLRDTGVTTRETADLLRMSESTLRSRLGKAAQNGHEVPV
jgi:hypothetical protein